jgi:pimeloyl-ACP methyl ester carboxylesterase
METHVFQTKDGLMMEYSIRGAGRPILVFHGGHSNCREEFGYDELLRSGYSLLTPSRAGYGQTSAGIGKNLGTACQAYSELLDHLGMDKIDVIAVSAGGASGIYWASHYPERVRSLTLQSAVSGQWHTPQDKTYKVAQLLFGASMEKYTWAAVRFMSNHFPRVMFEQMAPSFSTLPYSDVLARTRDDDIQAFCKMNNRQRSGHGFLLDLPQINSITESDLKNIRCPTLIQHSPNDGAVPIEHARRANRHIAGSKLQLLDTWGHLIWLGKGSEALHPELLEFLAQA